MKKLLTLLMIFNVYFIFGQHVIEVKRIELSEEFNETLKKAIQYKDSDIYKKIENLEDGLIHAKSQYEKYRIIVNTLGPYYTLTKQYDKAIDLWIAANKEGIFFPFDLNDKDYLPYVQEYRNNIRFLDFLALNDSLKKKANVNSKMEYFVNLPADYDPKVKYPLIFILHGGSGCNNNVYYMWKSEVINHTFVSVYPQGKEIAGSFACYYGQDGINDITEVYKQVLTKYSVDSSKVILAGQSDGGKYAVQLSYGNIPSKGLILAFPVIPQDFDFQKALVFKKRNNRIVMICGQQDKYYFSGQQGMANILDSAKIENQFIKYPDLGHGFPTDFIEQLNKGLQFVLNND